MSHRGKTSLVSQACSAFVHNWTYKFWHEILTSNGKVVKNSTLNAVRFEGQDFFPPTDLTPQASHILYSCEMMSLQPCLCSGQPASGSHPSSPCLMLTQYAALISWQSLCGSWDLKQPKSAKRSCGAAAGFQAAGSFLLPTPQGDIFTLKAATTDQLLLK